MSTEEFSNRAKAAVMAYKVDDAKKIANEAIAAADVDLIAVINEGFSAGIMEVGALFEAKKIFLPHMMAAANAMTAGMDIIVPEIEKRGGSVGEGLGTFVICSIEGDIHSIGKDIVAIMLKVAGFNVLNIGRDVPLKDIVAAAKDNNAVACGTSALMTSTMVGQKTLEEMMKEAGIKGKCLTNVGGAPVTQQWADEIGADVYSENANDCAAKFSAKFKA
ncbi:MAG: methyltransferase cognate corrinoid protein [Candidatus Methanomethylophilaceae archaeon]|nr:methyltransferase cognate corrinoid protein [Candidatus Methanomethylophilaceae archaeon]MBR2348415.1 methyltransferase cognate corrinoid protein [Candidatus Methanomethylophilaceae archaeon]